MTCSEMIFWESGYLGVYRIFSTYGWSRVWNEVGTKIFLFSTMTRLALEYRGFLPGLNWAGCEVNHWQPFNPEVRVELYLYSPYMLSQHWEGKLYYWICYTCLLCIKFVTTLAFHCVCTNWVTFYFLYKNMNVYELNIWSLASVYVVHFLCLTSTLSYNFTLYMQNYIKTMYTSHYKCFHCLIMTL